MHTIIKLFQAKLKIKSVHLNLSNYFIFQKILVLYDGFFFIPLASRLINEESTTCKKLAAAAIKSLLAKVSFEKTGNNKTAFL